VIASFRRLETVTRTAPLGVRFVDEVTGAVVSDGLTVLAPRAGSAVPARAVPTRGGVFALRGLPGLREVERGDGGAAFWASPPAGGSFRIEVRDALGRFHDFAFDALAPARGLLAELCGSPPRGGGTGGVPLFSTPSRPAPAAVAVVRAELRDADTGGPAAWARLEVTTAAGRARGVADARGAVAVFCPYPPLPTTVASPPASSRPSLNEQTWPVTVEACYGGPRAELDLCAVLDQPRAAIAAGSPPAESLSQTLRYGRELVIPGPLYLSRPA
jgi:hypothetical protein